MSGVAHADKRHQREEDVAFLPLQLSFLTLLLLVKRSHSSKHVPELGECPVLSRSDIVFEVLLESDLCAVIIHLLHTKLELILAKPFKHG